MMSEHRRLLTAFGTALFALWPGIAHADMIDPVTAFGLVIAGFGIASLCALVGAVLTIVLFAIFTIRYRAKHREELKAYQKDYNAEAQSSSPEAATNSSADMLPPTAPQSAPTPQLESNPAQAMATTTEPQENDEATLA